MNNTPFQNYLTTVQGTTSTYVPQYNKPKNSSNLYVYEDTIDRTPGITEDLHKIFRKALVEQLHKDLLEAFKHSEEHIVDAVIEFLQRNKLTSNSELVLIEKRIEK